MGSKNDSSALKAKYFEVYFIDPDVEINNRTMTTTELRRVVDIEWNKINRSSKYVVVNDTVHENGVTNLRFLHY